jgi:hypothetical protein
VRAVHAYIVSRILSRQMFHPIAAMIIYACQLLIGAVRTLKGPLPPPPHAMDAYSKCALALASDLSQHAMGLIAIRLTRSFG